MYNSLRSLEKITGILDSIKTLCYDKQLLKQVVQEYTNGHFLQHNRQKLSNIDRMSVSNVLTGCRGTTHGGVMRIMSPQLPAWRSPSICIPVEGIDQMISLQAAVPNGWGLFSFLSLDSARGSDTTYTGGNRMTHTCLSSTNTLHFHIGGGRM